MIFICLFFICFYVLKGSLAADEMTESVVNFEYHGGHSRER